jgi:Methane oxygenase PmoA
MAVRCGCVSCMLLLVWACFVPAHAAEPNKAKVFASAAYVDFTSAKELIGRYHLNLDGHFAKPFFWPLNGPTGVPITRAWPMEPATPGGSRDHPHQKSVWFCHGDVIPEGLTLTERIKGVEGVDFWSEGKGHGVIACLSSSVDGKNRVTTKNVWRTSDKQKVLDETRIITLHNFDDTHLFVFDITLTASAVPVTFGDTKEGSFGIRINDLLREEKGKGKVENADGKTGEVSCWGQLSAWCDYSGPLGGKTVGLAILDDPKNPYPACWHSRGYGLMAANPFGREKSGFPAMKGKKDLVHLAKGEQLRLRYGLLIHAGDAREGKVAEYFERFAKLRE